MYEDCATDENSNQDTATGLHTGGSGVCGRQRKLQKKWTRDEDFIMVQMIEDRAAIWDWKSLTYKNRDLKKMYWNEIAKKTNHSVNDAKIHWNTVKSRFNTERRKVKMFENKQGASTYKCGFELYDALQFLLKVEAKSPAGMATGSALGGEDNFWTKRKNRTRNSEDRLGIENSPLKLQKKQSEMTEVEAEAVGVSVAKKLARMNSTQALFAESIINEALKRGLLNALTDESFISYGGFSGTHVTSHEGRSNWPERQRSVSDPDPLERKVFCNTIDNKETINRE